MGYPPGYTPPTGGGVVAWEDPSQGFFGRWWGTVKEVCFNSRQHFAAAANSDNPWPAITFAMTTAGLIGLVLGVCIAIMYIAFGGLAMLGSMGSSAGGAGAAVAGMMAGVGIFAAIIYPIIFVIEALITPWIGGGVHHLILMLMKGTTKSYSHSVRVSGYAWAGFFWLVIPCIGGFATLIFFIIALVVGLDETHKCGVGKALVAVIAPPFVCFCCYFLFGVFMGIISH